MVARTIGAAIWFLATGLVHAAALPAAPNDVLYTNIVEGRGPWSIHVVRIPRKADFELRSVHATGQAVGLGELSEQIRGLKSADAKPIAGVNGDFYQRDGSHAGDPRGLQIIEGELISAPTGGANFWVDALGEPHTEKATAEFTVTWPDGSSTPIGLNGDRESDEIQLYTPAMGRSTLTSRGRDIILQQDGSGGWLPLRPGKTYKARVRSVRDGSNTEIPPGTMVLSVGPSLARELPRVTSEDVLILSTTTSPSLRGAKVGIGGGPVLVHEGKVQSLRGAWGGYEMGSQNRRHPRSAIAWNSESWFLIEVDGRQRRSVGMTLPELANFLVGLGCTEAMNLDGGGSATLWYDGKVRNNPCEGGEREIANSLVAVRKQNPASGQSGAQARLQPTP